MTTASTLDERLSEAIGDYIQETVTTAVAATAVVVSTALNKWDDAEDDHFNNYWIYFTDKANAGVERKVYDYVSSTGTLSVRGGNLTTDGANLATFRLYRYSYAAKQRALNDAIRELSPVLFKTVDDHTLITGNNIPNSHFEQWTSASYPDFYTDSTATSTSGAFAANTSAAYIRGGTTSARFTAGVASDYFYISSKDYPRLLDMMGNTINFRCWAFPEVADDAYLQIYTLQADGTAQTLTSTTTCPAGKFTLLELNNQDINDDIVKIEFRFGVTTDAKYCYFDNARITGHNVYEYYLPENFQDGELRQTFVQCSNNTEYPCDDLQPTGWDRVFSDSSFVHNDGTSKYLRLPALYSHERQIRLIGTSPLTTLSTFAGTTELDGNQIDLLISYAAYCLFRNEAGVPSSGDTTRYDSRAQKYLREYYRLLPSVRMTKPVGTLNSNMP
jgi:hypothetical protein